MESEQSQRPQTLRYQSNTTFLIGPNASTVPGRSMLPGLLQRNSQSTITTTPGGRTWPPQSPPALGAEPVVAAVEASELLQVGSSTVTAPLPQPAAYAPAALRRSHMTASLTEVSVVSGPGTRGARGSLDPIGSLGSMPPVPPASTVPPAPSASGWAGRAAPGPPLRRPNMPASVTDAHCFGSSTGSVGTVTTPSWQPYFATSMTEAPGSVAISSMGVIGCPSPRNSLGSMPPGMPPAPRPLRPPPRRRSLPPGQLPPRPPTLGRRFPAPTGEEIRRRPLPGVDFRDRERIDEGYDSAEAVDGRQDRQPPRPPTLGRRFPAPTGEEIRRRPLPGVDFRDRERIDEGYDSAEAVDGRQDRQPPRPPTLGRRFPAPTGEEIRRRPLPGADFWDRERIDEGYDSAEAVDGRQDRQPPLSRAFPSGVDFRERERIDEGYNSAEAISRRPPNRRLGPSVSRSARRLPNTPSQPVPVSRSKSGSGPHVSRIRMFQIEREFSTSAESEACRQTNGAPPRAPTPPPPRPENSDGSTFDDYGPSRPRVCSCPGTLMMRRGPPRRSSSGRPRGAYIKNDDDDDDEIEDLYMISKSRKKRKRKQTPPLPSPPPVTPTPSSGFMGFLSGLVGGRQQPPPIAPPARHAWTDSDSDDESEYELRRFDRRQLENFVRKIDFKQLAQDDETKEGRKSKRKEENKEGGKPEEKEPVGKAPEPEKKEENPPEVKTEPTAQAPMEGPLDVKVPVVFVFGGPGSGKGTQCDKIVQKYGFTHISSGDLLRAEVESGSDRGKEINEIMKKGELAPLAMILQLIKEAIKKNLATAKGFLIDGYPRNVEQGVRFEAEVCKCTNLVYFEVKDETMTARLMKRGQTSGRVDDNAETIAKRLKTFHDESEPVLEKYKDIVHKISAEEEPDKVFEAVTQLFDQITKPK
ncbi:uncharacterized protein [Dermacentor albipictus]|uniref:uncharacterized protein n=1 Tax=Dermacentor albipictus TaxID=60249 RepID=UPI0038FD23FA